jgi:hypothetical protein
MLWWLFGRLLGFDNARVGSVLIKLEPQRVNVLAEAPSNPLRRNNCVHYVSANLHIELEAGVEGIVEMGNQ